MSEELVGIVFMVVAGLVALGYPLVRGYARRIEARERQRRLPEDFAERLERIEQALEAIAIEVERIGEGQRFATQLLAGSSQVRTEQRSQGS